MICEKCGFEYTSERCPVCAANEANAQVEQKNEKSPCGLIGMIMGIASFFIMGTPLAIAGLILSIIGKNKCKSDGYATAGLISSILSLVYNVVGTIASIVIIIIVYAAYFGLAIFGMSVSNGVV